MDAPFVSPTGYVELNNDIYAIDNKSTRGREQLNPKEDLSFYFQTYLVPKYGLNNINVTNVASFMKELEMNWSKLSPDLKDNVMDIMVDNILVTGNYDFKNRLLSKIGANSAPAPSNSPAPPDSPSKSTFGKSSDYFYILIAMVVLAVVIMGVMSTKPGVFPKMF
jgi:hypothetical protein